MICFCFLFCFYFILKISFNPNDSSEILLTGNHICRQYNINNGKFSKSNFGEIKRCESLNITCHCWIDENNILLGLNTGFIYRINKNRDILNEYNVYVYYLQ